MPDNEKLKRKEKPKRGGRRRRIVILAMTIGMVLLFVWLVVFAVVPACGCQPNTHLFDDLDTQIAATNDAVETLLYQTQIASTPSP